MQHPTSKSLSQADQQAHKVLTYVAHSAFFEYLRNHYQSFKQLAKSEMLVLLKSAELLRISEERSMVISFNQPTVCVVVYGQVVADDKPYPIGKFFIVGQVKLSLSFKEKSLLVMLHKQSIEAEMQAFEDFFFKKKLIEKLMPCDLVKFTKKQMQVMITACDFRTSFADEEVVRVGGGQLGIYLLLDGTFSIISKEGVRIGDISLEYFGEEILWEKDYEFGLTTESVECRYIFISKGVLMGILTQSNLKALKAIYCKRVMLRKQMEKNMDENIRFTRDFMKKMTMNRKATVLNPEYGQPFNAIQKRIKQQLNFQNVTLSTKINSSAHLVPSRKQTIHHQTSPNTDRKHTLHDDSIVSHQTSFQVFEPKLYKDQKAKSESIFKRRTKSQMPEKTKQETSREPIVTQKEVQNMKDLPKTLSVLLKYYESTERLRPRPKTVKVQLQRGFVPCSKERRIMTTMKLHKEIFMREYFEIKALEDKAFKTWR